MHGFGKFPILLSTLFITFKNMCMHIYILFMYSKYMYVYIFTFMLYVYINLIQTVKCSVTGKDAYKSKLRLLTLESVQ